MAGRPYLDQLVTSPHIPKQEGQIGYCSKKLIPDLSCTGIRSELETQPLPVTTADGRMTKVFVLTAYKTMRELQRGIVVQNAKEEIFKLDHRQYIDKLLVDMEEEKRDKHERRMRHWKKQKDSIGFAGSFDSAFGESSSKWQPVETSGNEPRASSELIEDEVRSSAASPFQFTGEMPASTVEDDPTRRMTTNEANRTLRVRIQEANHSHGQLQRVDSADNRSIQSSQSSRVSQNSAGSNGFSRQDDKIKRIRTHSRMALFNSLLDVVEPPKSPMKRFGTVSSLTSLPSPSNRASPSNDMFSSSKYSGSMRMSSKGASSKPGNVTGFSSKGASGKSIHPTTQPRADSSDSFGIADSEKR